MIKHKTIIQKFKEKGEKTGWTYVEIPQQIAEQLNKNCKKSFRIKGKIDEIILQPISILPMGDGSFILPLNLSLRRKIKKPIGEIVLLNIELETKEYVLNTDFVECLQDAPQAWQHFNSLTQYHQNYFSKWIDQAKTTDTIVKRIIQAVNALAQGWGYAEMIRNK